MSPGYHHQRLYESECLWTWRRDIDVFGLAAATELCFRTYGAAMLNIIELAADIEAL